MLRAPALRSRLKGIRFLVCDVDGVLTDGGIVLDNLGHEAKRFCVQDGLGFALARLGGLQVAFLSARESKIVNQRAQECGVHLVMQGKKQKSPAFAELCLQAKVPAALTGYIGDDLLDLPVFEKAGLAVAVANAAGEVKQAAHWVTRNPGGQGAVREVVEKILRAQGTWSKVMAQILGRDVAKSQK
ncbi:HAD hydrolase family protein [candidate division FCPU426 bacterium]|nr:HAD hydrolase family protein [candidate division FCPU426 bacterium]